MLKLKDHPDMIVPHFLLIFTYLLPAIFVDIYSFFSMKNEYYKNWKNEAYENYNFKGNDYKKTNDN